MRANKEGEAIGNLPSNSLNVDPYEGAANAAMGRSVLTIEYMKHSDMLYYRGPRRPCSMAVSLEDYGLTRHPLRWEPAGHGLTLDS